MEREGRSCAAEWKRDGEEEEKEIFVGGVRICMI